jgi:hypothetical protein
LTKVRFLAGAFLGGTSATTATGAASTTGATATGVSTLYGNASLTTGGASVPGTGLPVNQLKIAFNIMFSYKVFTPVF